MPKKVIGLDPGSRVFKAVELERGFRDHQVTRRWRAPRVEENGGLAAIVRQSLGEDRFEGEVWTPVPLTEITSRLIRVPFSSSSKLEKVAPYELEGQVPFGADEMVVDHQFVERGKSSSWILAAGIKRDRLASRLEELGEAGLNPRGLIPEGHAYRSLARLLQPDSDLPFAFLDIGATHSVLTIGLGDRVIASRSINTGGNAITETLARRLATSLDEAEEFKTQAKVDSHTLMESAREALDPLANQVRNSLRYISAEEGISVSRITLCGGAALMDGVDSVMTDLLGIPCEVLSLPENLGGDLGPEDAHALALALEDLNPVHGVNFRKGEFSYRSEAAVFREKLVFPAVLLCLIIFTLVLNSIANNRIRQSQAAALKARVESAVQSVLPGEDVAPALAVERLQNEIERLEKLEENLGQLNGLTPLELLSTLSELIPEELEIDLEEVTLTDRLVTLEGIIPEHSDMDVIVESLKEFKDFKRFDTPNLRTKVGGGVKFSLRIFLIEEETEL